MHYFHPSALVQGWVHGTQVNDGFVLKAADEAVDNYFTFSSWNATSSQWPSLTINYTSNLNGTAGYSAQLDDRLGISVDAASGNLSVAAEDFHIAGTGLALNVAHYYNSADSAFAGDLGYGWTTSLRDSPIYVNPSGVQVGMPDGQNYAFYTPATSTTCGSGTFTAPPAINASLCAETDGVTYDLTFNKTQEVWKFKTISTGSNSAIGYRTSDTDRNGNTITYSWDTSHLLGDGLPALDLGHRHPRSHPHRVEPERARYRLQRPHQPDRRVHDHQREHHLDRRPGPARPPPTATPGTSSPRSPPRPGGSPPLPTTPPTRSPRSPGSPTTPPSPARPPSSPIPPSCRAAPGSPPPRP